MHSWGWVGAILLPPLEFYLLKKDKEPRGSESEDGQVIGLGGYTDYGKKPDKKKGKENGREEAKILRKRKQNAGGEGMVEKEGEGMRGR